MKATTQQAAGFKPIELTITIKSRRELEFLWELMNARGDRVSEFMTKGAKYTDFSPIECDIFSSPIYQALKSHL